MSVLHNTVASYDATDKMKVESTNTCSPRKCASLSVLFFISGHFRRGASVEQGLLSFWISTLPNADIVHPVRKVA